MSDLSHFIKRSVLDISVQEKSSHEKIENELKNTFLKEVVNILNEEMDKVSDENSHLFIDKLVIDIGEINADNIKSEFLSKVKSELRRCFSQMDTSHSGLSPENKMETLDRYLKKGVMHWGVSSEQNALNKVLIQLIESNPKETRKLIAFHLKNSRKSVLRLIGQFPFQTRMMLARLVLEPSAHLLESLISEIKGIGETKNSDESSLLNWLKTSGINEVFINFTRGHKEVSYQVISGFVREVTNEKKSRDLTLYKNIQLDVQSLKVENKLLQELLEQGSVNIRPSGSDRMSFNELDLSRPYVGADDWLLREFLKSGVIPNQFAQWADEEIKTRFSNTLTSDPILMDVVVSELNSGFALSSLLEIMTRESLYDLLVLKSSGFNEWLNLIDSAMSEHSLDFSKFNFDSKSLIREFILSHPENFALGIISNSKSSNINPSELQAITGLISDLLIYVSRKTEIPLGVMANGLHDFMNDMSISGKILQMTQMAARNIFQSLGASARNVAKGESVMGNQEVITTSHRLPENLPKSLISRKRIHQLIPSDSIDTPDSILSSSNKEKQRHKSASENVELRKVNEGVSGEVIELADGISVPESKVFLEAIGYFVLNKYLPWWVSFRLRPFLPENSEFWSEEKKAMYLLERLHKEHPKQTFEFYHRFVENTDSDILWLSDNGSPVVSALNNLFIDAITDSQVVRFVNEVGDVLVSAALISENKKNWMVSSVVKLLVHEARFTQKWTKPKARDFVLEGIGEILNIEKNQLIHVLKKQFSTGIRRYEELNKWAEVQILKKDSLSTFKYVWKESSDYIGKVQYYRDFEHGLIVDLFTVARDKGVFDSRIHLHEDDVKELILDYVRTSRKARSLFYEIISEDTKITEKIRIILGRKTWQKLLVILKIKLEKDKIEEVEVIRFLEDVPVQVEVHENHNIVGFIKSQLNEATQKIALEIERQIPIDEEIQDTQEALNSVKRSLLGLKENMELAFQPFMSVLNTAEDVLTSRWIKQKKEPPQYIIQILDEVKFTLLKDKLPSGILFLKEIKARILNMIKVSSEVDGRDLKSWELINSELISSFITAYFERDIPELLDGSGYELKSSTIKPALQQLKMWMENPAPPEEYEPELDRISSDLVNNLIKKETPGPETRLGQNIHDFNQRIEKHVSFVVKIILHLVHEIDKEKVSLHSKRVEVVSEQLLAIIRHSVADLYGYTEGVELSAYGISKRDNWIIRALFERVKRRLRLTHITKELTVADFIKSIENIELKSANVYTYSHFDALISDEYKKKDLTEKTRIIDESFKRYQASSIKDLGLSEYEAILLPELFLKDWRVTELENIQKKESSDSTSFESFEKITEKKNEKKKEQTPEGEIDSVYGVNEVNRDKLLKSLQDQVFSELEEFQSESDELNSEGPIHKHLSELENIKLDKEEQEAIWLNQNSSEVFVAVLFCYLRNLTLPWWSGFKSESELSKLLNDFKFRKVKDLKEMSHKLMGGSSIIKMIVDYLIHQDYFKSEDLIVFEGRLDQMLSRAFEQRWIQQSKAIQDTNFLTLWYATYRPKEIEFSPVHNRLLHFGFSKLLGDEGSLDYVNGLVKLIQEVGSEMSETSNEVEKGKTLSIIYSELEKLNDEVRQANQLYEEMTAESEIRVKQISEFIDEYWSVDDMTEGQLKLLLIVCHSGIPTHEILSFRTLLNIMSKNENDTWNETLLQLQQVHKNHHEVHQRLEQFNLRLIEMEKNEKDSLIFSDIERILNISRAFVDSVEGSKIEMWNRLKSILTVWNMLHQAGVFKTDDLIPLYVIGMTDLTSGDIGSKLKEIAKQLTENLQSPNPEEQAYMDRFYGEVDLSSQTEVDLYKKTYMGLVNDNVNLQGLSFEEMLIEKFIAEIQSDDDFLETFRRFRINKPDLQVPLSADELMHIPENNWMELKEGDRIYISNAGLVIFWPFFKRLFGNLNYLEKGLFKDEVKRERAVHLLQYLVDGSEDTPEYLLVLNKILCGLPPEEPIKRYIKLTKREKEEAMTFFTSVISQWKEMKNTTVQTFRQTFLQREGILEFKEKRWFLKVNKTAMDVLLQKLPWGMSVIRYTWGDHVIFVEWK